MLGQADDQAAAPDALPERTLLLSVDFEDWHQLVRRRVGAPNWREPGPALARQTEALLTVFGDLGVRATFFILGMAARAHPELVRMVAQAGHEIGCHGDGHQAVHTLTPDEFAADVQAARATIGELTGQSPAGYRAPMFSITNRARWAYPILAQAGFAYDASQCESPAVRDHIAPADPGPHPLADVSLWEFPVAVWRPGTLRLPVGGPSYWTVLPRPIVLRGLAEAGPGAGLYLHPHELDTRPLRPRLGPEVAGTRRVRASLRAAQRNATRLRTRGALRAIADGFRLIPYGDAHAELTQRRSARP